MLSQHKIWGNVLSRARPLPMGPGFWIVYPVNFICTSSFSMLETLANQVIITFQKTMIINHFPGSSHSKWRKRFPCNNLRMVNSGTKFRADSVSFMFLLLLSFFLLCLCLSVYAFKSATYCIPSSCLLCLYYNCLPQTSEWMPLKCIRFIVIK